MLSEEIGVDARSRYLYQRASARALGPADRQSKRGIPCRPGSKCLLLRLTLSRCTCDPWIVRSSVNRRAFECEDGVNRRLLFTPGAKVKNGEERLVVLNRVARSVVAGRRGIDPTYVFTYRGRPKSYMLNTGWRTARAAAGLSQVRVHDLKHTFGRRLRAAGVSFEDRQDLLGHRSGRITTHYSAAELERLIEAANRVCERSGTRPELFVLRGSLQGGSRKTPASHADPSPRRA